MREQSARSASLCRRPKTAKGRPKATQSRRCATTHFPYHKTARAVYLGAGFFYRELCLLFRGLLRAKGDDSNSIVPLSYRNDFGHLGRFR